ncbi:MAG: hypothetical protein EXS48_02360 [Candidatus Staskawiczbacteria bacterium]|nr:hypothetical protein [Candidatus Staskawiczbacteria bacterium]
MKKEDYQSFFEVIMAELEIKQEEDSRIKIGSIEFFQFGILSENDFDPPHLTGGNHGHSQRQIVPERFGTV